MPTPESETTINRAPVDSPRVARSIPVAAGTAVRRALSSQMSGPFFGVSVVLILMCVYLGLTQDQFLTGGNIVDILSGNSVLLVIGVGLTLVLIVGGFDLSVGGVLALTGVLMAKLIIGAGLPVVAAIAIVVVAASIFGFVVNGLLTARLALSFFVVTLGTMSITRGLSFVATGGISQGLYNVKGLNEFGSGSFLGIPYLVLVAGFILIVFMVIMRYTGFGRMAYAVGGNPEASRLAGIPVVGIRAASYGICAGLAAIAGVMQSAHLATAEPSAATGIELTAAAAVLLGGTTFAGGVGSMLGTLLGTLFLGVLSNGLTLSSVSAFWQNVITGGVLLIAIVLDRVRAMRSG